MNSVFFSLFKIYFELLDRPIAIPFKSKNIVCYVEIIYCRCIKKISVKYKKKFKKFRQNLSKNTHNLVID